MFFGIIIPMSTSICACRDCIRFWVFFRWAAARRSAPLVFWSEAGWCLGPAGSDGCGTRTERACAGCNNRRNHTPIAQRDKRNTTSDEVAAPWPVTSPPVGSFASFTSSSLWFTPFSFNNRHFYLVTASPCPAPDLLNLSSSLISCSSFYSSHPKQSNFPSFITHTVTCHHLSCLPPRRPSFSRWNATFFINSFYFLFIPPPHFDSNLTSLPRVLTLPPAFSITSSFSSRVLQRSWLERIHP